MLSTKPSLPFQVEDDLLRRATEAQIVAAFEALLDEHFRDTDKSAESWKWRAESHVRAVVSALCYLRDHDGPHGQGRVVLTFQSICDHLLQLRKIEALYLLGWSIAIAGSDEASTPSDVHTRWPQSFLGIKKEIEQRLPAYKMKSLEPYAQGSEEPRVSAMAHEQFILFKSLQWECLQEGGRRDHTSVEQAQQVVVTSLKRQLSQALSLA
jgi:hypothetical protein